MDDNATQALPQTSPVLWLLSLLIACVAAHLLMGHVRLARREGRPAPRGVAPWLAATGFGLGVTAAMTLAIASQALAYPVGFFGVGVAVSTAAALAGAVLATLPAARWLNAPGIAAAATVLGVATVASGALMVRATGLLPGLAWSYPLLVAGAALAAAVSGAGLWLGLLGPGQTSRHRVAWRALACAVVGVAIVLAQQFVLAAGDMDTQIGSAYREHIGSTLMTVTAAAAVPALIAVLLFDLYMRELRARIENTGTARRRRRRRHQLLR
jgi:NO-binding membrane sensor protein with MHYT domain